MKTCLPESLVDAARTVVDLCRYESVRREVVPVARYCESTGGGSCRVTDGERMSPVCSPLYYPARERKRAEVPMPPTYCARLHDATLIGESDAVLAGGYIVYDAPVTDNVNFTDCAFLDRRKIYRIEGEAKAYFARSRARRVGQAVSLVGNYSWNYYHWVLEFMAKLWLLSRCDIPRQVPLAVDACVRAVPQFMTYLEAFGGGRPLIFVRRRERLCVGGLYLLSAVNVIPPNFIDTARIEGRDILFDMRSVDFIRERMSDYSRRQLAGERREYPGRVFISRRGNRNRSYNEPEVERAVLRHGFRPVMPQHYSVAEQIELFAGADFIVAASGAALTNIIYCKRGCRVAVLTSQEVELSIFSSIADHLGVEMIYLAGKSDSDNNIQTGFEIDPAEIERLLSEYCN